MARLKYSVDVRETKPIDAKKPELGHVVTRQQFFKAGEELPEWTHPLVGAHVYEDGEVPEPKPEPKAAGRSSKSEGE